MAPDGRKLWKKPTTPCIARRTPAEIGWNRARGLLHDQSARRKLLPESGRRLRAMVQQIRPTGESAVALSLLSILSEDDMRLACMMASLLLCVTALAYPAVAQGQKHNPAGKPAATEEEQGPKSIAESVSRNLG